MSLRSDLLETLAVELERPRPLPARVLNYIGQTYGVDQDAIGPFLSDRLFELEDYEVDLILSPVFTPKLADQAVFAGLLDRDSVGSEQWPDLIEQLVRRPTRARLIDDVGTHIVPLHEVTIKRYVDRLRLDGTISEPTARLIDGASSASEISILKAVARRAVWSSDARNKILECYLAAAVKNGSYTLADAIELVNTVETVKPAGMTELLAWIPRRKEALREQINTGGKLFFSQNIQELYGGERDQRSQADGRISAKESELSFIARLWQTLAG
jgi:hypothetical protein